jgi:hypothetical protein
MTRPALHLCLLLPLALSCVSDAWRHCAWLAGVTDFACVVEKPEHEGGEEVSHEYTCHHYAGHEPGEPLMSRVTVESNSTAHRLHHLSQHLRGPPARV